MRQCVLRRPTEAVERVQAVAAYCGDVVAVVGEIRPTIGVTTVSPALHVELGAEFTLERTVRTPAWPHMCGEMTIWRRRFPREDLTPTVPST